jgi:hypothetical protein
MTSDSRRVRLSAPSRRRFSTVSRRSSRHSARVTRRIASRADGGAARRRYVKAKPDHASAHVGVKPAPGDIATVMPQSSQLALGKGLRCGGGVRARAQSQADQNERAELHPKALRCRPRFVRPACCGRGVNRGDVRFLEGPQRGSLALDQSRLNTPDLLRSRSQKCDMQHESHGLHCILRMLGGSEALVPVSPAGCVSSPIGPTGPEVKTGGYSCAGRQLSS